MRLLVTLVRSRIGRDVKVLRTLDSIGLVKIGDSVLLDKIDRSYAAKLKKLAYLLSVEEK